MLVAYEVQYQLLFRFEVDHDRDNMDYASSNAMGAMAACVTAHALSGFVDYLKSIYYSKLLHRASPLGNGRLSSFGACLYATMIGYVHVAGFLRLGRESELDKLVLDKKLTQELDESAIHKLT